MGLTANSTGNRVLGNEFKIKEADYTVAIAGNPNVGKSTVFNGLTGMHQHTGNWPGKTVSNATGTCQYEGKTFLLVDIPGTYSLMSNSQEEEIARDYICFGNPDCTVVIIDATCLERNLNLVYQTMEITPKVVVCVNLLDEAKKKGIHIDLKALENKLGVRVVGTTARKKKTLKRLQAAILEVCKEKIVPMPKVVCYQKEIEDKVEKLLPAVEKKLPENKKYLARWLSLKLIDGEASIIESAQRNLEISLLKDKTLKEKVTKVHSDLEKEGITILNKRDNMVASIVREAEKVAGEVVVYEQEKKLIRDRRIDQILTSRKWGIPIMLLFLGIIFWITISGANYPSQLLSELFAWIQDKLLYCLESIHTPEWVIGVLVHGMYRTLTWVIAVMLPPMAIFFPIFTILEDLGYLPRIAFNLDNYFKKACATGKQALTMCMGFGCNAAGVVGCRIIDSPRERQIAMITNAFVPCNGRFPFLITIATIFIGGIVTSGFGKSILATLVVLLVILLGIGMTLLISKILSKTILKGMPSSFILELPPYRKPQIGKVIVRSLLDRTLYVLLRAIEVAAPAGIVIWIFANVTIGDMSILAHIAGFLDPFAKLMGLDGYILTAFILGLPANEIVLPIILMSYMQTGNLIEMENITSIGEILVQNGWTILTAINVMLFTLLHFPCSTTLLTIKKETGKWRWAIFSFLLPTICGILLCMITTFIFHVVGMA